MRGCSFQMNGPGNIAQIGWEGAFQTKCDHKAGFHSVPLAKESWQYFAFQWRGVYYVFTTLCFGWKISPFTYHSLSEAVASYLRSEGLSVLTWIDDFYFKIFRITRPFTSSERFRAVQVAGYLMISVFYRAGYIISITKHELEPTTDIIFFEVQSDSIAQRFSTPEDKLDKLGALNTKAVTDKKNSYSLLEKMAGKCTSLSRSHFMHKEIVKFQRSGGTRKTFLISLFPRVEVYDSSSTSRWLSEKNELSAMAQTASPEDDAHRVV